MMRRFGIERGIKETGRAKKKRVDARQTVALQKMNRDVKSPSCAPIYAAIPKRFDTNLTCL
jgi:hypothetical protein